MDAVTNIDFSGWSLSFYFLKFETDFDDSSVTAL